MHSVNEYDKDDNLISYTDFNGDKTTYIYDEYGNQTGIKYSIVILKNSMLSEEINKWVH